MQEKPFLSHLNLGDAAHNPGDGTAFEAVLKDTSGAVVGEILGWLVTVDFMDSNTANSEQVVERIGLVTFNFGEEDKIIAQGGSIYHKLEKEMILGFDHRRAVVGGTGKYKGAKGEITTTRNDDGTYKHSLEVRFED